MRVYIDSVFAKLKVVDRLGLALRVLSVHMTLQQGQPAQSQKNATQKGATGRTKTGI